jgi:hypothetical protein
MKTLILILAMLSASTEAFGAVFGDYSMSYEQEAAPQRYQVEEILDHQGVLMLLQIKDLKTNTKFQYWATDEQLEPGVGQTQFLKAGVIPAGA